MVFYPILDLPATLWVMGTIPLLASSSRTGCQLDRLAGLTWVVVKPGGQSTMVKSLNGLCCHLHSQWWSMPNIVYSYLFVVLVSGCHGYSLLWCVMTGSLSKCKMNYHNNFSFHAGIQMYYRWVPDIIQVGKDQFIERELISSWVDLMLMVWWAVPSHS